MSTRDLIDRLLSSGSHKAIAAHTMWADRYREIRDERITATVFNKLSMMGFDMHFLRGADPERADAFRRSVEASYRS